MPPVPGRGAKVYVNQNTYARPVWRMIAGGPMTLADRVHEISGWDTNTEVGEARCRASAMRHLVEVREEALRNPALVLADWLEEHDEPAAAAKLRQAFPLE